ncbi:hypothetical protein NX059_001582 [Plenodomus lindquistii]|nr:hypothetical protein NX059_001582 [Plenodomus lindquistii]
MAYLLGWKDVLRPIRDGYRHLFPTPDTGPTPEERRKQRGLDRLKGFTYFDTFEQLEAWTEDVSDPLQRSNTPLLPRSETYSTGANKSDILLVHDYSGNYHDYESTQSIGVANESYTCEYLQHVDTFIYFSHKLVCIPPPTWTNTLHRNGVKALGTVLIEPQTKGTERLLEHVTSAEGMTFPLVEKLVAIAQHYGFDGYLINIEKPFSSDVWALQVLEAFLSQLKRDLGETKQLIWYDALTSSNKISYQNALNASNIAFAKVCGSILTNYCWTEANAESSKQLALRNDFPLKKVFFGIDVWAQNTTTLSHPRVTYPERGGGGTNTGVAVAKLAGLGLSAGVFAPAWSFEHFPGHKREVERAVWEGKEYLSDLACSCGDCSSRHRVNVDAAIIKHANEAVVGSKSFFYTDFHRAFGRHGQNEKEILGGHSVHAQLGQQSILPFQNRVSSDTISLTHFLDETTTELVIEATTISPLANTRIKASGPWLHLPLYKLAMPLTTRLDLHCSIRKPAFLSGMEVELYVRTSTGYQSLSNTRTRDALSIDTTLSSERTSSSETIEELGVRARGIATFKGPAHVLWISSIAITPASTQGTHDFAITGIRTIFTGSEENLQLRLQWTTVGSTSVPMMQELPYSDTTGVFSYFAVSVDGLDLGRAYAHEHIITREVIDRIGHREVLVEIVGVGFDGRELARWMGEMCLQEREEGYDWVESQSGDKE